MRFPLMSPWAVRNLCIVSALANVVISIWISLSGHNIFLGDLNAFAAGLSTAWALEMIRFLRRNRDVESGAKEVRAILIDPERQTVNEMKSILRSTELEQLKL